MAYEDFWFNKNNVQFTFGIFIPLFGAFFVAIGINKMQYDQFWFFINVISEKYAIIDFN